MEKIKEEMLEKLKYIKGKAENDIKTNHHGYEKCIVKNVTHYNKKVELINKETGEKELFDLCVVLVEDQDTHQIFEMYYLNGEESDFTDLLKKYESPAPIKDVVNATKENEEKLEEERDEELRKEKLEELEAEKEAEEREQQEKEEAEKLKQQFFNEDEESLTGEKPKYVIQTIDVNKTYIDNLTTVRKGFNLPYGVQQIAFAKPLQEDENVLSADMTMYMLDGSGRIVEEVDGKTIHDFFEADNATGRNPSSDENAKFELSGHAERDDGHTMRRFKSKENPNLHLSVEQKKIGDYAQVYAGRKTMDGNDAVEVQLETRNLPVQTSLEMQKVVAGYKGIYNIEDIDKEIDEHEAHGDDMNNIHKENADGKDHTIEICESPYIPGTEMTWEELAEKTGEGIPKLQDRFERELEAGKEPTDILAEIEYDYEMTGHEHERKLF